MKDFTSRQLRVAGTIQEIIVTPAESVLANIDRIRAMRLAADVQATVIGELDTLAGEMRLKLIRESEALRRLGETLGRFERRLMEKSR